MFFMVLQRYINLTKQVNFKCERSKNDPVRSDCVALQLCEAEKNI